MYLAVDDLIVAFETDFSESAKRWRIISIHDVYKIPKCGGEFLPDSCATLASDNGQFEISGRSSLCACSHAPIGIVLRLFQSISSY